MTPRDSMRALLVAVLWGLNFVAIDKGLQTMPPLLFVALRFTLTVLPAIFLVPRPGARWYWVALVGLFINVGQFGLLFVAIHQGSPAGLASLVLQCQAIFTLVFAVAILQERPRPVQLAGTIIATTGIAMLAVGHASAVPLVPLMMVIAAGASWGAGNICARLARARSALGLTVWAALVAPIPMFALSLSLEGPGADLRAVQHLFPEGLLALGYVVIVATLFGYGTWTSLLRKYPAPSVAPFSLLVPIVGILGAWLLIGETPTFIEVGAGIIVLTGLLLVSGAGTALWQRASSATRPAEKLAS